MKSKMAKNPFKGHSKAFLRKVRSNPVFGRMGLTKGQETALDVIWSRAVKARASQKCEYCLKSGVRLESHHFYGRRNKSVRHIVSNGFSLCHTHHRLAEEQSATFVDWAIRSRGPQWYDDLLVLSRQMKVYKEFSIIKAYLETFLDDKADRLMMETFGK